MPKLLDLFCCEGGAAQGYADAGFEVVGVDILPQPRYPFMFVQSDALEFAQRNARHFDAIHASPPCQDASITKRLHDKHRPRLVAETRRVLRDLGKPYVIENVDGASLANPTLLCGNMFGLRTYRHRLFQTSFPLTAPLHWAHTGKYGPINAKMGRPVGENENIHIVGNFSNVPLAREIMGCDWMSRRGLSEAIPPAYTRWIGEQLLAALERAA